MSGARTRRAKRLATIFPIVKELAAHGQECDNSWMTRRDSRHDWYELTTPISQNARGDDYVTESNFRVAERLIDENSSFGTSYRWDAWPGGQIQSLIIRADDAGAIRTLEGIVNSLSGYPVLCDMDAGELEWEQKHPEEGECYSEGDCCTKCDECGYAISEHGERNETDHFYNCDQHPENQEA